MKVRAIAAVLAPCLAALVYAAPVAAPWIRLTPVDIAALQAHAAGTGTSGVAGIRTTLLAGDPAVAGPYTISVSVPAHTTIAVHTHRDNRTAVVVSGVWYFGYNDPADPQAARALPAGSFYTEPEDVPHFARTGAEGAVVVIMGYGPSDTSYVK